MFTFSWVENEALFMTYAEVNSIFHFIIRQIADREEKKSGVFCR